MTIAGLGVATLLQVFSQGLRLHAQSAAKTEAVARGSRLMDELLSRKQLPDGSDGGKLGGDGRWTAQVQTLRDEPTSLNLGSDWQIKEIDLQVVVNDGGRDRQVEFKTLRLSRKTR